MREFARYDLGDYPIFYLVPKLPVLFYSEKEIIKPTLNFSTNHLERIDNYDFCELNIFGHGFLIPTHKNWYLNYESVLKKAQTHLSQMYRLIIPINQFTDVDFACEFMNSKGSAWEI